MTKKASIAIIAVVCVIALFFGVCSCLPDGLEYGKYNEYHAATNLIQGDSMFDDCVLAKYEVKLDDGADIKDVASAIRSRLGDMYGRWFCPVSIEGSSIVIKLPKTANSTKTSEESILSAVTATGKVEVVTETTYSEDNVILTADHVKSMSTRRYSHGSNSYYIVRMKLNKEGKAIAAKNLVSSSSSYSAYLAIDGTVAYGIVYDGDMLQVYAQNNADCQRIKGLTKNSTLDASLTRVPMNADIEDMETESVSVYGGLIFAIIFAVLVLGSWIFYAVRYKMLAVAGAMSQLIAIVVFIMFAGMVYFSYLNIASAIGIILGYCMMSAFTCLVFEKIRNTISEKTFASARHRSFADNNKWNYIVHAIVLVAGAILWLIPTGVTVPLGNALVYSAVLSFGATMGLNRLFTSVIAPLGGDEAANYGVTTK